MLTRCIFEIGNYDSFEQREKRESPQTMELDDYLSYTSSISLLRERERERAGLSEVLHVLFDRLI